MQSKALRIAVVSSLALSIAVMIFPTVVLYAKASIFVRRVFNLEAVVSKVSVSQNAGDADININIRPVDPSADGQTLRPDILPSAPQSAARFLAAVWNPTIVGGERKVTMPHLLREWITPLRHSDFSEQCRLCAGFPRDDAQACTMTSAELHPCPRLFSCRDCLYDLTRLTGKGLNDFTIETELFFGSPDSELNGAMDTAIDAWGLQTGVQGDVCVERAWDEARAQWYDSAPADSMCGKRVLVSGWVTVENNHDPKTEIHPVSSLVVDWTRGKEMPPGAFTVGAFIDGSHGPLETCDWWRWLFDPTCHPLSIAAAIQSIWMFDYRAHFDPLDYPYTPDRPARIAIDLARLQGQPPSSQTVGTLAQGGKQYWQPDCTVEPVLNFNALAVEQADQPGRCPMLLVGLDRSLDSGAAWMARVKAGWQQAGFSLRVAPHLDTPGGVLPAGPLPAPLGASPTAQAASLPVPTAMLARPMPAARAPAAMKGVTAQAPSSQALLIVQAVPMGQAPCTVAPEQPVKPFGPASHLRRWYRWTLDVTGEVPPGVSPELWFTSVPYGALTLGTAESVPVIETGMFHRRIPVELGVSERDGYSAQVRIAVAVPSQAGGLDEFIWNTYPLKPPRPSVLIALRNQRIEVSQADGRARYVADVEARASGFCGAPADWRYSWTTAGGPEVLAVTSGDVVAKKLAKAPILRVKAPQVAHALQPSAGPQTQIALLPGEAKTIAVVVTDQWKVEQAVDAVLVSAPMLDARLDIGCGDTLAGPQQVGMESVSAPSGAKPCRALWLVARAADKSYGTDFPSKLEGLRFEWRDLKYQGAGTGGQWKDIPAAWVSSVYSGDGSVEIRSITPLEANQAVGRIQGSVTVSDSLGRSATAHVVGANDVTPVQLLAERVKAAWQRARPMSPLPSPRACGGDCADTMPSGDRFAEDVSALLYRAARVRQDDYLSARWLRMEIDALDQRVFASAARGTGAFANVPAEPPVFSVPATSFERSKNARWTVIAGAREMARAGIPVSAAAQAATPLLKIPIGPGAGGAVAATAAPAAGALTGVAVAPAGAPAGVEGTSLTGRWNSNIGQVYEINQQGAQFTWTAVLLNQQASGTIVGDNLHASWKGAVGQESATGRVVRDAQGGATRIEWSNGVVFTRATGGAIAGPVGVPPSAGAIGAGPVSITGSWSSNIGLVYEISQVGTSFTWTVASTGEQGKGTLSGSDIAAQFTGPRGAGSVKGRVVVDAQGRATRIEWSNGVVFTR